jgi:hypothetical protein
LIGTLRGAWREAWEGLESPRALIAARFVVSLHALWLFASRPDLPDLFAWPEAFWQPVSPFLKWRFLIFALPVSTEWFLYAVLWLALLASAAGIRPRVSCFAAAALTYHFAPLEDVFNAAGATYFRGLTTSVLALFVFSFALPARWNAAASRESRWPLTLVRVLFAASYFLSGIAKLRSVGPAWASAANLEAIALGVMLPEVAPPWAHVFVGNPVLCALAGVAGFALDFSVLLAAFSRRLAVPIVVAAGLAHVVIVPALGAIFLAAPLLLLFLDWGRILGGDAPDRDAIVAAPDSGSPQG